MKYQEALKEWLEYGGFLWWENGFYWTNDDGEAKEKFNCRDMEQFKDNTIDEMCKIWAKEAMEIANESAENIERYLDF